MKKILLIAIACITLFSCQKNGEKHQGTPLVSVHDKVLYLKDVQEILPEDISPQDSTMQVNKFIDIWVKNQLLIKKAELNLRSEEKDVQKQLDEYRSSLLIYKYKQKYTAQKIDTVITQDQLQKYYNENKSELLLNMNIVKVVFAKLPFDNPNQYKVKYLIRSDKEKNKLELEKLITENAGVFTDYDAEWIAFTDFLKNLPLQVSNQEEFLKNTQYIESQDSVYNYFVKINDYKLKNEVAPLIFVEDDIRTIIMNKRKNELIDQLESNIYRYALNRNKIKYFYDDENK